MHTPKSVPRAEGRLRRRFVCLPLQSVAGVPADGTGLFLHFLLGNVLALHTGVEEFWFGWRAQRIFTEPEALHGYCRAAAGPLDIPRLAEQQDVRFWLTGRVVSEGGPSVRLQLTDAEAPPRRWDTVLDLASDERLVALRQGFFHWLSGCGLPFPEEQVPKCLWPEASGAEGRPLLGAALETFYRNGYEADPSRLDGGPFRRAVAAAPDSYLALDLLGWALYRQRQWPAAREAFTAALETNPHGVGAVNGLLRCAVQLADEADAYRRAEELAALRGDSPETRKAQAAHLLAKGARARGDGRKAVALYRLATAWDPTRKPYADGLAAALQACGRAG